LEFANRKEKEIQRMIQRKVSVRSVSCWHVGVCVCVYVYDWFFFQCETNTNDHGGNIIVFVLCVFYGYITHSMNQSKEQLHVPPPILPQLINHA